jgi:hypothetical protein
MPCARLDCRPGTAEWRINRRTSLCVTRFFSKGKSGVDTFYKIEKSPLGSGNFAVVKKAFKIEMKEADYKKMKPPVEADEQAKKAKIPAQVAGALQ